MALTKDQILDGIAELGVPRIHFGVGTGELLGAMSDAGADVVRIDRNVPASLGFEFAGPRAIDCHHHFTSPAWIKAMEKRDGQKTAGFTREGQSSLGFHSRINSRQQGFIKQLFTPRGQIRGRFLPIRASHVPFHPPPCRRPSGRSGLQPRAGELTRHDDQSLSLSPRGILAPLQPAKSEN